MTNTVTPEDFGAVGNGTTDDAPAFNTMFESVPKGTTIQLGAKDYRIKKQAGKPYGIRLRKNVKLRGSRDVEGSRLVYDNTFGATDDVFLIQPPGADEGLHLYTIYGLEISDLHFTPFAQSLGYPVTLFPWDPAVEYCNYARDVMRFDARPGTGFGCIHVSDVFAFSSGGGGGGVGTGASVNIQCTPDSIGMYSSVVERIHTMGGIRFSNIGDSNRFTDLRLNGKHGIYGYAMAGAVENVIENVACVAQGPALIWRWGHATFRGWNVEAHQKQYDPPDITTGGRRIINCFNDLLLSGPTLAANCITFDGIRVADQIPAAQLSPVADLIHINNCDNTIFRRVNFYGGGSHQPDCIDIGPNCKNTRLEGPFTRQDLVNLPMLVRDAGVGTYWMQPQQTSLVSMA